MLFCLIILKKKIKDMRSKKQGQAWGCTFDKEGLNEKKKEKAGFLFDKIRFVLRKVIRLFHNVKGKLLTKGKIKYHGRPK